LARWMCWCLFGIRRSAPLVELAQGH
jgi:hypothetical protein